MIRRKRGSVLNSEPRTLQRTRNISFIPRDITVRATVCMAEVEMLYMSANNCCAHYMYSR